VAADAQCALHVDTFHSVVKVWVYPNDTTLSHGPLHLVPGSHRVSLGKLRWLFNRTSGDETSASTGECVREPSLRFDSRESTAEEAGTALREAFGLPEAIAVLPLGSGVARTLVVADTGSLHARGVAEPGVVRRALRPMGAVNDGGVTRLDPFRPV
jgi:hypothetical protein